MGPLNASKLLELRYTCTRVPRPLRRGTRRGRSPSARGRRATSSPVNSSTNTNAPRRGRSPFSFQLHLSRFVPETASKLLVVAQVKLHRSVRLYWAATRIARVFPPSKQIRKCIILFLHSGIFEKWCSQCRFLIKHVPAARGNPEKKKKAAKKRRPNWPIPIVHPVCKYRGLICVRAAILVFIY